MIPRRLLALGLLILAASPAAAFDQNSPMFGSPFSSPIEPDAPLAPKPGDPPGDLAFGAYQRGYFITALREATKRVAAKATDAAAMTLIGEIYHDGYAVKQDIPESVRWWRLASALGDRQAAFELGVALLEGAPGVPADHAAAKEQFTKAAAKGHPGALYNLGVLAIEDEQPEKRDFKSAAQYFRQAADAGDGNAAYSYGVLLREGRGVPLDVAESARWLKRAADGGIIAGQVEYAIMLFNGVGVTSDETSAAKIFQLAAARRNPIAQNRLAHLYLTGRGLPLDLVRTALWHSFAKAAGIQDAELDKATAHLSDAELTELHKLVHQQSEF